MEESLGLIQARIQQRRGELGTVRLRVESHEENLRNAHIEERLLEESLAKLEEARTALELAAGITCTSTTPE